MPTYGPGPLAGFSFARSPTDALLWGGLVYLADDHEPRPYGVATIDLELGAVTYHRQGDPNAPRPKTRQKILPVPSDVNDVSFDRSESGDRLDVWFATSSGAAHLSLPGEKVALYGETEGLENEILHGITVSSGGLVDVATRRGVGTFAGERWSFPCPLPGA